MYYILQSCRFLLVMTFLCGFLYTFFITAIAQTIFPAKSNGSLIQNSHQEIIGSELIAQNFQKNTYFWPRPSAADYATMPSGASNLGPTSKDLAQTLTDRQKALLRANPMAHTQIPADAITSSASGLDPHISPHNALYQAKRIAAARKIPYATLQGLIETHTEKAQLGILGESRVNVLRLNLALDAHTGT